MTVSLQLAEEADVPTIVDLMNAAFRGTSAQQGWNVETFIKGTRTTESLLREEMAGGVEFLLAKEDGTKALQGCVSLHALSSERRDLERRDLKLWYLERRDLKRWYLGALTVDPALQNAGFGSELLRCAEAYAVARGARVMEITVVNVRDALIAWYQRRSYRLTGETRPFPYGDHRYGVPTRGDLEFVVLEKELGE
jgi:ribosomal protein S18 acetylase RimI-like enzyme